MNRSKKSMVSGGLFVGILFLAVGICFAAGCIGGTVGDDRPPIPQPNDIQVTKTDENGAVLWKTVLDTSDYEGFEDFTETTDGRFAIVCIDYGQDTRIQKCAFVDGGGAVDSVTVFDNDTFKSWDSEIVALSDGSVAVFDGESDFVVLDSRGTVMTEATLCDADPPVWPIVAAVPSPGDRTLAGWGEFCVLIEKNGDVVWKQSYGDPEFASRHPVLGLSGGDSVVLFPENTKPEVSKRSDLIHLLRLDGDGNIVWDVVFPGDDSGIWRTGVDWSLQETGDGTLVLLTTEENTESGIFGEHTSVVYTLRRFDAETGKWLSEKSSGDHELFEHALLYADGSVDSFTISDGTLTLRRYNDDLKQISADVRIEGEYNIQHDVIATSDGGYLIVSIV
ncbi:hypothetical protein [Methanogenium organophilum]|uniref:PQQ-binding-like beta-propeller repeat protein n=1 Tax=Methanogenium organophilum TaxID=2199 RepID=A0A9X9S4E0_METOG|nr:hypothetical protein [Methanogenium organophilum]WAI01578.1 hypothetical protein OU421_01520 [Methanogenium organophilum]